MNILSTKKKKLKIFLYYFPVLIIPEAGMRSLLKLSERMVRSFCSELSASATNKWRALPRSRANNRDTTLMMNTTFNKDDHGKPLAATVVFATSVELPATPKKVFDFLSHEESRTRVCIIISMCVLAVCL